MLVFVNIVTRYIRFEYRFPARAFVRGTARRACTCAGELETRATTFDTPHTLVHGDHTMIHNMIINVRDTGFQGHRDVHILRTRSNKDL